MLEHEGAKARQKTKKIEDIKYLFDFSSYHRKKTEQKQCGFVVESSSKANGIKPQ